MTWLIGTVALYSATMMIVDRKNYAGYLEWRKLRDLGETEAQRRAEARFGPYGWS